MGKRCLIIYSSYTGNTVKVATRFKATFEREDWECDIFKVDKKPEDILDPPYDMREYDFVCAGSGIRAHLPYNEILNVLRRFRLGVDPRIVLRNRGETIPYITGPLPPPPTDERMAARHHKMVLGADSRKCIVFTTYSGCEFGPAEAAPAMMLLALELEHIGFKCIGQFCCPGRYVNHPTPRAYHGDIRERPNEKDLLKAEMFIEEKLEETVERPPA
jgi:hypothetical protein